MDEQNQSTQPEAPTTNTTPTGEPMPAPAVPYTLNEKPQKNTGLIIGIVVAIVAPILILAAIVCAIFLSAETNISTGGGGFQDIIDDLYDEIDRASTNNYVAGVWNCAPGTGSENDHDNFTTTLELNNDMTFRYGKYGDLRNNHYGGTYTFEDEHKQNNSGDYNYYMLTFDTDEMLLEGEEQDVSDVNLSQLEMGITRTSEGKSAITIFVSTYNMYYCYTY